MSDDNDNGDEFDSGPYCQHWSDPNDCEEECRVCGHYCYQHDPYLDGACGLDTCACPKFTNEEQAK